VTKRIRYNFHCDNDPNSDNYPTPTITLTVTTTLLWHHKQPCLYSNCFNADMEDSMYTFHQQKLNLLHEIYLVYCTHKPNNMKSRFPWYMALLYCSTVFIESSQCGFQAQRPVYPLLRMWQRALGEWSILSFDISQIISQHTPTLPYSICPRDDESTCTIRLMKHVVLVFKDPQGVILPMMVTMQKWFTISKLLIEAHQRLTVQPSGEGYATLRLWFHTFGIRLQWTISSITFTTIMICRQNLE